MTKYLFSGSGEDFKGAYHAALGALAFGALVYNVAAFLYRRERHLARNVAIYGCLTALELGQVAHHRRPR